jgi:hypothetical protein
MAADPLACLRHIDDSGGCRLTAERSDYMSAIRRREPKVAEVNGEGHIEPQSELDVRHLRVALARWVHPKDVDRAVKRLVKADSLRPIRPASQACQGKSILEMLWEELDAIVERLMAGGNDEDDKGKAQGVAWAIALVQNPYLPDIEHVRAEAMDRWEADQ